MPRNTRKEMIFEYLSSVGFLNKSQTETIRSREDVFDLILNDEIRNSTRKLMISLKSPYQTDKDLGLDLEDGLSSVFPVNSRCATFEIQGENSVGYLSVNPNGSMVEIFKSGEVIGRTMKRVAVFKLEDGTAIVSIDGGIKQYKPDELLEEYDSIYNTPELFTMLDIIERKSNIRVWFQTRVAFTEPGAAKAAVEFGAQYGVGRGLQGQTYALITKNLKAGYHEKATGITYATEGYKSLSAEQISENVKELYQCAKQHPDKFFIMAYKNETWPNGSSKKEFEWLHQ
ncbi:hypothetical protein L1887_51128 [Cichorium endivia]|nr:hypothetical protein L1887_51128 [Cichorium endivia]